MSYSNTKKHYGDVGYFNKLNTTTQTRNEHSEINEKGTVVEIGASEQERLSETEKEEGKCLHECVFEHHNIGGNLCMVANRNIKYTNTGFVFPPFFHFQKIIAY